MEESLVFSLKESTLEGKVQKVMKGFTTKR